MPNIDLRPAALPIVVYYKGDVSMRFNFTSGGSTYPLTGATAAFVISEKNGTAALSLSGGSGLTINEAGGYIDLAITNAQIVALASQEYNYEFSITISGDVWPIMDSVFIVSEDGQADATSSDISVSLDGTNVDVSVVAPAGSIGHIIQDEGVSLTDRDYLNFTGAGVTVTDAGGKTVVTIPGGGGTWGSITGTLSDQADLQTALDGKVDENAAIVGATKTKITYDSKGLVTAGDDAAIADISGLQTALDGKAETSHTHTFADIESGVLPDLSSSATVQPDGAFAVKYDGGNDAIQVLDDDGSAQIQAKSGGASISVGAAGVTIIGDPFVSIESDASTGDAGQVLTAIGDGTATWQDAAGGGGSVEIIDITYADMETAIGDSTLTPGQLYRITDAAGTDLGFICQAIRENEITVNGTGGYLNADFQGVGDYGNTPETFGTQRGIWAAGNEGGYSQGDVVIWNLLHYQLTDSGAIDGTDPETNTAAYTLLDKATYPETYITAWDTSEFDFANNWLARRSDKNGNDQNLPFDVEAELFGNGETVITLFQWGRDGVLGNPSNSAAVDIKNAVAIFFSNSFLSGAEIYEIMAEVDTRFESNVFNPGVYFGGIETGENCAFVRNTFFGGVENIVCGNGFAFEQNTVLPNGTMLDCAFGDDCEFKDSTIDNNSLIGNITTGNNCRLNSNTFGKASFFGDSDPAFSVEFGNDCFFRDNTLFPNAIINSIIAGAASKLENNTILNDITVSNKTFAAGVEFSGNTIGVDMTIAETISDNIIGKRAIPGFSDIATTIDITGLTALDFTAAWAQYRGIFYLTSANSAETIAADSLSNFPKLFPFRLVPVDFALTLTGTAAASATNGSIVMSGATIVLDGTNGDFVELEADATGTFVRVKNVQIYA